MYEELRGDEEALANGLREIPVPTVSRDFDERVLAAAGERRGIAWLAAWRPALAGAACAVPLMLWLLAATTNPGPIPARNSVLGVASPPISELTLDSPNLSPLSLRRTLLAAPVAPSQSEPDKEKPGQQAFNGVVS